MRYQRLAPVERYQIEVHLRSGSSIRSIARKINRNPSTISRELKGFSANYDAEVAICCARIRSGERRRGRYKIKGQLSRTIRAKLLLKWSPEQIVGRMCLENGTSEISHQSIYKFLHRDKVGGGILQKNLRQLRKQRADRKSKAWLPPRQRLSERTSIDERPGIVESRTRLGDLERDTVRGKLGKAVLLTIVDRTSRLLKIKRMNRGTADLAHTATLKALKDEPCLTITNDNGCEFERHEETAKALGAKIYFAHPYRSWERGTNENMNGLIRQYFPRKKDLSHFTIDEIQAIETELNSRPRKCLGFETPLEVHNRLKRSVLR